jgi:signal transduction histidine kinase
VEDLFDLERSRALDAAGLHPSEDGAFGLLPGGTTYLEDGKLDPARLLRLIDRAADDAERAGYGGLALIGETVCIDAANAAGLAECESRLNELAAARRIAAVCCYERERGGALVDEMLHTHPLARIDGTVCRNPHYLPPAAFLSGCSSPSALDHRLTSIRALQASDDGRTRELARREALVRWMFDAMERDRRAIAREMHDDLGQIIAAIHLGLQGLDIDGPARSMQLEELAALIDGASDAVRTLALELRPTVLDDLGLAAALRSYLRRRAREANLDIHLETEIDGAEPAPAVQTACFRIVQEAVTNAVRHAGARAVHVTVHAERGALLVAVADDGAGFDRRKAEEAPARGHLGILGMEERATLAGGRLTIDSSPGGGTTVRAELPLAGGREASCAS